MASRTGPTTEGSTRWPADADPADEHSETTGAAAPSPDLDDPQDGVVAPAGAEPVLDDAAADRYARRWSETQARFVDDPRTALDEADRLVAELISDIADRLSRDKDALALRRDRDGDGDTESLRLAMQHYRALVDRLLST